MQTVGKAFIGIGLIIAVVSACCVDSVEPYGTIALIVVLLGGIIAGAGYGMMLADKPDTKAFYCIHRKDRLDADVEFIEIKK